MTYGTTALIFGNSDWHRILNSFYFASLALWHLMILFNVCLSGQALENTCHKLSHALDDFIASQNVFLGKPLKRDFAVLKERLRNASIYPFQSIKVNNSGFLAMLGTIVTYNIVLMQFKANE